jgi:transposase
VPADELAGHRRPGRGRTAVHRGHERHRGAPPRAGPAAATPAAGAGRQGLLLASDPRLAAPPRHPRDDPATGRGGGRPPAFDKTAYRQRNVAERCINRLKQWRGLAMRTDKLAVHYQAALTLAGILLWTKP